MLTDEGYEARAAGDGQSALALLQEWSPCLILLDILMPKMDGQAFLRELRHLKTHPPTLPIVLVSGVGGPMLSDVSMRVADVIRKPFSFDLLLTTVARLVT